MSNIENKMASELVKVAKDLVAADTFKVGDYAKAKKMLPNMGDLVRGFVYKIDQYNGDIFLEDEWGNKEKGAFNPGDFKKMKRAPKRRGSVMTQKPTKVKVEYDLSPITPEYIVIQGVDAKSTDDVNSALMALYYHLAKNKRDLLEYFDLKGMLTQKPTKLRGMLVVETGFKGGDFRPAEKVMKPILKKLNRKKVASELMSAENPRRKPFIGVAKKLETLRGGYPATSDEAIFLSMVRDMAVHISRGNWSAVKRLGGNVQSELDDM